MSTLYEFPDGNGTFQILAWTNNIPVQIIPREANLIPQYFQINDYGKDRIGSAGNIVFLKTIWRWVPVWFALDGISKEQTGF